MLVTMTVGKRKQSSRWCLSLKENANEAELRQLPNKESDVYISAGPSR